MNSLVGSVLCNTMVMITIFYKSVSDGPGRSAVDRAGKPTPQIHVCHCADNCCHDGSGPVSSTCQHPVGSGEHHNEHLFALSTEITWIHFGNCLRSILRCDLKLCVHFPNVLLFLFRILNQWHFRVLTYSLGLES